MFAKEPPPKKMKDDNPDCILPLNLRTPPKKMIDDNHIALIKEVYCFPSFGGRGFLSNVFRTGRDLRLR